MSEQIERCEECKWWVRVDLGSLHEWENSPPYVSEDDWESIIVGHCRAEPPQLLLLPLEGRCDDYKNLPESSVSKLHSRSQWPVMWDFDFCGKFTPK